MKLKFKDYDKYILAQRKTTERKIEKVFISDNEVELVSQYFLKNSIDPKFGICHGVRSGWEVKEFRENT